MLVNDKDALEKRLAMKIFYFFSFDAVVKYCNDRCNRNQLMDNISQTNQANLYFSL